jgi:hypothetical protein
VVLHPYLYHIGEPQRDEEIDVEEWDGDGGKTETMYVCMSGWMCMDRGAVLVLTSFAMVFLMQIYAPHHGQTCEGKPIRQEDADGAQGSATCSQFIARKKLLPARPLARFRIA